MRNDLNHSGSTDLCAFFLAKFNVVEDALLLRSRDLRTDMRTRIKTIALLNGLDATCQPLNEFVVDATLY